MTTNHLSSLRAATDSHGLETDRIREALQFIDASDRDTWLRMGMAIKSELGEEGFGTWEAWSQQADSFKARDARDVWKSINASGGITVGTLFHKAKANGWQDAGYYQKPSQEEIANRKRITQEQAALDKAKTAKEKAATAKKAKAIWDAATEARADQPYLSRKGVDPVSTLREIDAGKATAILGYAPKSGGDALAGRLLVVPVEQGDGISTLELIDGNKRKTALVGRGTKVGGYWATERLPEGDGTSLTLLIGEGVATVLSAKEATGHIAIAALSSGNLPAVAKAMRERYPVAALVILADLVKTTGEPDPHAIEAAKVGAGKTAIPDFGTDRDPEMKDMNDMAALHGMEAVKRAIANASAPAKGEHQPTGNTTALPASNTPTDFPSDEDRPKYIVLNGFIEKNGIKYPPGVYYCGMTEAKKDQPPIPYNLWFCSPLYVDAITFDNQYNNFGRLLRFKNSLGNWREWGMPMEMLRGAGDELRGELLSMGVEMDVLKARQHLPAYLQREHPRRRVSCALQVGWHGDSFVLPNEVIGKDKGNVIFQSSEREHEEHTKSGSLEGWREGVSMKASGNPLLIIALCAGFAGAMLKKCNAENGGIHFVGDSSTGKTTAIEAACSIWGGKNYRRSWRATANGMEGAASLFNDCLLALDEISECDPREVGAIVYALGNGVGKQRASRTGTARSLTRWRCFVLSSGERTIGTVMGEAGHREKAGQSVRLLDIPCKGKYGCWDDLRGESSASRFSDSIKRASSEHHGIAGRVFLEKLTHDSRDFCDTLEECRSLPEFSDVSMEGQDKRAAGRFALLAMAGELATEYSITGWSEGEALDAAIECFAAWRSLRGKGNDERRQILTKLSDFIERHGDGRFSSVNESSNIVVRDRAGWWRDVLDEREYLFTGEGLRDALKGFDFNRALEVLRDEKVLANGLDGKNSRPTKIRGRSVRLYSINLGDGHDD